MFYVILLASSVYIEKIFINPSVSTLKSLLLIVTTRFVFGYFWGWSL